MVNVDQIKKDVPFSPDELRMMRGSADRLQQTLRGIIGIGEIVEFMDALMENNTDPWIKEYAEKKFELGFLMDAVDSLSNSALSDAFEIDDEISRAIERAEKPVEA